MARIGIIGAGNIGGTLARNLVKLGHDVEVANSRGPESLAEFAASSGAKAVDVEQAVHGKDLIVVSIPTKAVLALPRDLFEAVPADVPVIDTNNYYPRERDGRIDAIENGKTESQWVADTIGHPVVKVFNNIYFKRLADDGKPAGTAGRLALPVSGDDPAHKAKVIALLDELGFDAIDNGGLAESWRHQPGTPAYVNNADRAEVEKQLAAANPSRTPAFQGSAQSPGDWQSPR
jgi:8-hydroxy-5-deazaflavin:NADPH oxidoreductase